MSDTPENGTSNIIGYCDSCKKPIRQGDPYEVVHRRSGQSIYCAPCNAARKQTQKNAEYREEAVRFRNSMICATIAAIVVIAIAVVLSVMQNDFTYLALIGGAAAVFMFVAQCFWTSYALDLLLFFCRSFHLPMLIFTLDLDGIIWLITVKLFGAILCGILSVLLFLFGFVVALLVSIVTFPFCLAREIHTLNKLRANTQSV